MTSRDLGIDSRISYMISVSFRAWNCLQNILNVGLLRPKKKTAQPHVSLEPLSRVRVKFIKKPNRIPTAV